MKMCRGPSEILFGVRAADLQPKGPGLNPPLRSFQASVPYRVHMPTHVYLSVGLHACQLQRCTHVRTNQARLQAFAIFSGEVGGSAPAWVTKNPPTEEPGKIPRRRGAANPPQKGWGKCARKDTRRPILARAV